ncbi:MAG: PAS domain S-box protein [Verrucomicrobia bacterium]|nr:PAS domain S-box protein [Verrucomicrobiota bacterium]
MSGSPPIADPGAGPGKLPEPPPGWVSRYGPTLLIFALGLLATVLATRHSQSDNVASDRLEFDFACREIGLKVKSRLKDHEQILRSVAGLFAASTNVTRSEWHNFVTSLRVDEYLPGIQGIGHALLVAPGGLEAHERAIRSEGFPDYHVWPPGNREIITSIIYLEPFTNRNLRAFGYDMFSESTRRSAMELARDENTTALTGKVKLVQETSTDVQAGTLMFVPIYKHDLPIATVADRRAALQGWVYSPYRMNDLMRGILGEWGSPKRQSIRLETYDGEDPSPDHLLHDTHATFGSNQPPANGFSLQTPVTYAGRRWTLSFTQTAHPGGGVQGGVWAVAATGTALSLLLAGLLHSLRNTRYNARRLAHQLTADLQHATERLGLATSAGGVGIWDYDVISNTLTWDDQMFRLYSTTREQFSGAYEAWIAGVHPEDRQRMFDEIQKALSGQEDFNTEFRVLSPDRSVRHIRALALIQHSPSGQPLRMVGTNWDITDRKEAEAALKERDENIHLLLNSTAEAIYGIDLDGNCTFCNSSCLRLLGYQRPEELFGKNMHWEIHGKHADGSPFLVEDCRIYQAFVQGEPAHVDDEVFWRADGSSFPAEYWSYPQRRNGVIVGAVVTFLDITERHRIESALRESQLFLLETQRIARLAGWKANPHTDYLEWTAGVFEIIEAQQSGQPGLTEGLKFYLPEYIPTLKESITRCLETGERFALECPGITSTGKMIWTEVRGLAPMTERGRAYVMGTFQDITERKRAEVALRESEANFRTFFESMTDIILVGTPAGQILFTNSAVTRTLGYSPEELLSMKVLDLHPVPKRAEAEEIFTAMFRGDRTSCPLPLERKDGTLVPVETRVWFGKWNGTECLFGVCKNLTAEVDAQQRFERLFRSNPALMSLSTLPDLRFFDVNDAFLKVMGFAKADVLGHTPDDLGMFPGPELPFSWANSLQSNTPVTDFEVHVRRRDGAIMQCLFSGEIISSQGRQYFLAVMIDITSRKQAEEELLRTLAAERELSLLRSNFVSMVSHEFRTPLSAILGAAEMLEDYYDRLTPEKRTGYFQLIRQENQRLTNMLQEVLLQGQLDAGRVLYIPRPTDVLSLCQRIVTSVQAAFPKHPPILFEKDAPEGLVMADENLLERVLSNLLANALKYSPALTPVSISIRRIDAEWVLSVRDQGIGIPATDQATMFSAFRRGGNVGNIKGTGVGLYVVRKCAELQGGRIEFESRVGQGSTFSFHLPWQPCEPPPIQ